MTYATDNDALDDVYGLLDAAWQAGSAAIAGYVPTIRWPGRYENTPPPVDKAWARVSTQTVAQSQAALANGDHGMAVRYATDGLLFVQVFAPIADSGGFDVVRDLATLARDAFRGVASPGGAWYTNARVNELNPDDKFYRRNAIIEYQFDVFGRS